MIPRFVLVILVAVAMMGGRVASACELTFAWSEWPPYQGLSPAGAATGLDIDLVNEAGRRMDCRVRWQEQPFQRALAQLREGVIDGQAGLLWTAERAEYGHYSWLRPGTNALFIRHGEATRFNATSLPDLLAAGFRIVGQKGATYSPDFERLRREPAFLGQFSEAPTTEAATKMLIHRRVDGFIDGQLTGRWEIARLGLDTVIEEHPTVQFKDASYVLFSRRSVAADRVAQFDRAITAMKEDGTLDRLLAMGAARRPDATGRILEGPSAPSPSSSQQVGEGLGIPALNQ